MKPIEREILEQLKHDQLVDLVVQQQKQTQLQDEVMAMQEKRIKDLENEIVYLESVVANHQSINSQGRSA